MAMASTDPGAAWTIATIERMGEALAALCPDSRPVADFDGELTKVDFRAWDTPKSVLSRATAALLAELEANAETEVAPCFVAPPRVEVRHGAGDGQITWALRWLPKAPASPAPEASFADAPKSLGEHRGERTGDASKWTPRDLLVRLLRDHDSGECRLEAIVVSFKAYNGASGYWNAAPDLTTAMGLLAQASAAIHRDGSQ